MEYQFPNTLTRRQSDTLFNLRPNRRRGHSSLPKPAWHRVARREARRYNIDNNPTTDIHARKVGSEWKWVIPLPNSPGYYLSNTPGRYQLESEAPPRMFDDYRDAEIMRLQEIIVDRRARNMDTRRFDIKLAALTAAGARRAHGGERGGAQRLFGRLRTGKTIARVFVICFFIFHEFSRDTRFFMIFLH